MCNLTPHNEIKDQFKKEKLFALFFILQFYLIIYLSRSRIGKGLVASSRLPGRGVNSLTG